MTARPWKHTDANHPDLDRLLVEDMDAYHAQRDKYLSSHALGDFRHCPLLYHRKQIGLIADKDRQAYLIGRATHALVLEGRKAYLDGYAVGGPVNPKTGKPYGPDTQKFAAWAAEQDKDVITFDQADLVEAMAAAVRIHEEAQQLLAEGVAERVARAELEGVPCQVRPDWIRPDGAFVDFKTCENLDWFERDARIFGYVHQLAFYRAVLEQVLDCELDVHLIAVEKREPYRCGVWDLPRSVVDTATKHNQIAIRALARCRYEGHWPTGYEKRRTLDYL